MSESLLAIEVQASHASINWIFGQIYFREESMKSSVSTLRIKQKPTDPFYSYFLQLRHLSHLKNKYYLPNHF